MATGYQYWEAEPSEKEIEAANRECLKNLKGAYEPAVPEHFKLVTLEAKPIFLDKPYEEQYSKDAPPPLPTNEPDPSSSFGAVYFLKRLRGRMLGNLEKPFSVNEHNYEQTVEWSLNMAHLITVLIARIRKEEPS